MFLRLPAALAFSCLSMGACLAEPAPTFEPWMNSNVATAWGQGYKGNGVSVSLPDVFNGPRYELKLKEADGVQHYFHGQFVGMIIASVAPGVKLQPVWDGSKALTLGPGANIINVSYSILRPLDPDYPFAKLDRSIIDYAKNDKALVVKSAGNESLAINQKDAYGRLDLLAGALKHSNVIYVGKLTKNGTPNARAERDPISNYAGPDAVYQSRFLFVGADNAVTVNSIATSGVAGILSGYAAIVGSKFKSATPEQIGNKLLATARTDTIKNYSAQIYGRGEASLSRALAPATMK